MRLIFYSKWGIPKAKEIDLKFVNLLGDKSAKIGYISFNDEKHFYFDDFKKYYKRYDLKNFYCLDLKQANRNKLSILFRCKAIFLPGGNTFYFLRLLKRKKIMFSLKEYVDREGILVGMSAGAIIMTSNIRVANIPSFNPDKNQIGLKNLKGLNLVKFEFLPHFNKTKKYINEVLNYSKKIKNPLYVCPNGSGIVVNNKKLTFVNKIFRFQYGKFKEIN